MKQEAIHAGNIERKARRTRGMLVAAAVVFAAFPLSAFAAANDESGAVCLFLTNINTILNIASMAIVTIAIIFAGYQIAYAHKRFSDVAPVLVGAVLIGGAAQFAKMILPDNFQSNCGVNVTIAAPQIELVRSA